MSESMSEAADFAAQWQADNPGAAQVDITTNSDGTVEDIGPTIYPDSEPD